MWRQQTPVPGGAFRPRDPNEGLPPKPSSSTHTGGSFTVDLPLPPPGAAGISRPSLDHTTLSHTPSASTAMNGSHHGAVSGDASFVYPTLPDPPPRRLDQQHAATPVQHPAPHAPAAAVDHRAALQALQQRVAATRPETAAAPFPSALNDSTAGRVPAVVDPLLAPPPARHVAPAHSFVLHTQAPSMIADASLAVATADVPYAQSPIAPTTSEGSVDRRRRLATAEMEVRQLQERNSALDHTVGFLREELERAHKEQARVRGDAHMQLAQDTARREEDRIAADIEAGRAATATAELDAARGALREARDVAAASEQRLEAALAEAAAWRGKAEGFEATLRDARNTQAVRSKGVDPETVAAAAEALSTVHFLGSVLQAVQRGDREQLAQLAQGNQEDRSHMHARLFDASPAVCVSRVAGEIRHVEELTMGLLAARLRVDPPLRDPPAVSLPEPTRSFHVDLPAPPPPRPQHYAPPHAPIPTPARALPASQPTSRSGSTAPTPGPVRRPQPPAQLQPAPDMAAPSQDRAPSAPRAFEYFAPAPHRPGSKRPSRSASPDNAAPSPGDAYAALGRTDFGDASEDAAAAFSRPERRREDRRRLEASTEPRDQDCQVQ